MSLSAEGVIESLSVRVIERDKLAAVSFILDGERFSAEFDSNFSFQGGEPVRVKFERRGRLNKITQITQIADTQQYSRPAARLFGKATMAWYFFLSLLIAVSTVFALFVVEFNWINLASAAALLCLAYFVFNEGLQIHKILRHFRGRGK